MDLLADLLGLLGVACAALAGIFGFGVLTAKRLKHTPDPGSTGKDHTAERKNEP